jgi:hypothetical protein
MCQERTSYLFLYRLCVRVGERRLVRSTFRGSVEPYSLVAEHTQHRRGVFDYAHEIVTSPVLSHSLQRGR